MTTPYTSWLASWGPLVDLGVDINTGEQTQTVTAFNGTANQNYGDAVIATSQNVGDVEAPSMGSLLDASLDINTGIQEQTVTAFNGEGNFNGGNFTAVAEQNVGDVEAPGASIPSLADLSLDDNLGVQTQNVTAFNGAGNVNAGDFTVAASQNVGDVEAPSA
ncbi:MAG: hypothetical protein AAF709_15925, partial [Pseudomonadota bacterium]